MGQMKKAIGMLLTIGVSTGAMVFAVGCTDTAAPTQSNASSVHGDVTDIRPIEPAAPASYQAPAIDNTGLIPTAPQAVTADVSTMATPMMSTTPDLSSSSSSIGEKTHTVRRGETLFSIAKSTYGTGRDWKKIIAVNPGLSPSHLKVGQVLQLP
jgi:nucleoid-associated protein YgaU